MWNPSPSDIEGLNKRHELYKASQQAKAEKERRETVLNIKQRIAKRKLECKQQLIDYYEKYGELPSTFSCTFKLHKNYGQYAAIPEVQKSYPDGTISYKDIGEQYVNYCDGRTEWCSSHKDDAFEVSINNLN